eukprot:Gb_00839 [translate_table: standard]
MECNKDEAGRAMEIAQRKLGAKDLEGARKFVLKAQQLYPSLEGLSQIMAILEVHLAAEKKVNGEMDWYGILQLDDFMAEDSVVKKQYRKLALLLHPDKNKSVGAEGAFKLIVEAWGVLSDKVRRAIYDHRRNSNESKHPQLKNHPQSQPQNNRETYPQNHSENRPQNPPQNPPQKRSQNPPQKQPKKPPQRPPQRATPKKKPSANGFRNTFPTTTATTTAAAGTTTTAATTTAAAATATNHSPIPPIQPQAKSTAFWTVCPYCSMQYEYLRIYENHNLLCRNCQKPFLAVEAAAIPIPINGFNASLFPWSFAPMGYSNHAGAFAMGMGGFANGPRVENYHNINFVWGGAFPGINTATTSTAETVNISSENVMESEETRSNEGEEENSTEEDEIKVPIKKKIGKEASEKLCSGRKTSSAKASPAPKVSSSPKVVTSPKVVSSPKVASSPKVSERPKKRKSYDKVSEPDVMVAENPKKSPCTRKDVNNVEVETVQSEPPKEQEKRVGCEPSNASHPFASQPSKPIGKQVPPSKQIPPTLPKDCSAKAVRNLLVEKAKMEILKNLTEAKKNAEKTAAAKAEGLAAAAAAAAAVAEEELRKRALDAAKVENKVKKSAKNEKKEAQTKGKKAARDKKKKSKKQEQVVKNETVENPITESQAITVPDSDFYDFDKDRTENCFEANQIWSMYDDENGMPRFYARIQKVVSLDPFKVQMNWIEPKINKYQTCGDFKVGKSSSNDTLNIFSHVMRWEKSSKGIIRILPRKSDVWAIYREWDSSWDELTPPEVRHKYEMVEVLTDFTDELGVSVVPLIKVGGFKNVFQKKQLDLQAVERVMAKTELLRFSHQVPARRLTEGEVPNMPEGCWELDPAGTPIDLLFQVSTEQEEKVAG